MNTALLVDEVSAVVVSSKVKQGAEEFDALLQEGVRQIAPCSRESQSSTAY